MAKEPRYRVSELAHLCEVNPRTIDYYTTAGLLEPVERSRGGHRFYSEDAVLRLRAIKSLQAQGLSLEAIGARLAEAGADVGILPRVEHLREELRRLEGQVADLTPELAAVPRSDEGTRLALQASVAGAASYALMLAQELMDLLNRGLLGVL
jgi:DNA-binding transcriptional MerR regulator